MVEGSDTNPTIFKIGFLERRVYGAVKFHN